MAVWGEEVGRAVYAYMVLVWLFSWGLWWLYAGCQCSGISTVARVDAQCTGWLPSCFLCMLCLWRCVVPCRQYMSWRPIIYLMHSILVGTADRDILNFAAGLFSFVWRGSTVSAVLCCPMSSKSYALSCNQCWFPNAIKENNFASNFLASDSYQLQGSTWMWSKNRHSRFQLISG